MADPTHILVISHTHWDREWYRTYQEFRLRLVEVVDQVLDLLAERPDFAHFTLDGQAVILEDYLAIRPERASQVREFVQAGRLHIGPWYVQPDEFLVSGESLIRNLMLGERVARPLGGAARIGWLPDTFGHVAQLPQILRNFGIDNFVFTRGMGDELPEPRTEFWWEAPNGDRVLALHQLAGYWNAGNLGYTYFWGDTQGRAPDL
jgi:alpha-mannosidase